MDNKITNYLMVFIVAMVFGLLTFVVVRNTDADITSEVISAFILLASNIGTFFFTKFQYEKMIDKNKDDTIK